MYFAYTDINHYLDITLSANGQVLATQIIPAICAFVDDYCNRTWTITDPSQNITETFDGGTKKFFIATPPIGTIVSVTVDGNLQDSNFYYNYGTYVELFDEVSRENQNVVIVYTTGANVLPLDLQFALIRWASQLVNESDDSGKQTTRVQTGPIQQYFKEEGDIPDFVLRVLEKYRLVPAF